MASATRSGTRSRCRPGGRSYIEGISNDISACRVFAKHGEARQVITHHIVRSPPLFADCHRNYNSALLCRKDGHERAHQARLPIYIKLAMLRMQEQLRAKGLAVINSAGA